ncbi:MAG: FtsX-like permease family protein [bacterium]|nr:FtsX-like permease family protein [bacterium]
MTAKIINITSTFVFWILNRFVDRQYDYGFFGDIEEIYNFKKAESGSLKANIWLYIQMIRNIPLICSQSLIRSADMFHNYFKIALRNIQRRKIYSTINIFGLSLGLTCSILILLWVQDELSFDKFHKNYDSIYRVAFEEQLSTTVDRGYSTPPPMGPALVEEVPEISTMTRYYARDVAVSTDDSDNEFTDKAGFADATFLDIFTLEFITGDPATVLADDNTAIITKSMADRLFGDSDPSGKSIIINDRINLRVAGVIEDIPENSTLKFNVLINFNKITDYFRRDNILTNWNSFGYATYFLLNEESDIGSVDSKIVNFYDTHVNAETSFKFFSVPLSRIHLHSLDGGGPIIYVYIFAIIAAFILAIACINFMNLTTAQSMNRAKEVGIRKIVGSRKSDLIKQFFSESSLLVFLSFVIAIGFVILLLPQFNMLTGKTFTIAYLCKFQIIASLLCLAVITALISSSYPSIVISSYLPVNIIKGIKKMGYGSSGLRKVLVVFQFSISIALIVSTIVVLRQVEYFKNRGLGFDRDNKIYFRYNSTTDGNFNSLKDDMLKSPQVENITVSSILPGAGTTGSVSGITWEGNTDNKIVLFHIASVDYDFAKTFDLEMADGRFFSMEYGSDVNNYIINEEAARQMGLDSPVGKEINARTQGNIIGLIRDFNLESLHSEVVPMLFMINPRSYRYVIVDINSGDIAETTNYLQTVYETHMPNLPFDYAFLDDNIGRQYYGEDRLAEIYTYFASMAILISCMGLLGLSTFMTKQRTKEIGVRKVLGAESSSIVILFSRDFLKLVLLANLFALPAGWYFMNIWLQNFAYRITIGVDILAVAGMSVILLALLTVCYNALKSAFANPVDSLRNE